ncbi:MAG: hypothetical protein M3N17_05675 [Actinomycetota bacterium]|nr:hypothetical protein [Actinomycetota bacterium]
MSDELPRARLPCGTDVGRLVTQVADGEPGDVAHQRDCPHCQAALAELHELWDAAAGLAAEAVDASGRIDRVVMRRIRREVFVRQVMQLWGGILPRLGRALLTYGGLIPKEGSR